MTTVTTSTGRISVEDFLGDRHATKYRDVVAGHSEAFARVLAILNDPGHQAQLLAAERYGRPALSGVVDAIEADERIAASLASPTSARFRQTVGVAVRLAMEALGWSTTGHKGPVRGATHFRTAERYKPPPAPPVEAPAERGRAALLAVAGIGDESERGRTADVLLRALAQTRQAENRVF